MTKKQKLQNDFKNLKGNPIQIKLWISMPSGETEIIINPNVIDKMIYIEKTYDDNLVHNNCQAIQIEKYEFRCSDENLSYSFGEALSLCKKGFKIARKNWNGKGMFVYYVPENSYPAVTDVAKKTFGDMIPYRAYLALKTVDNKVATWLPSISDVLADDWFLVGDEEE